MYRSYSLTNSELLVREGGSPVVGGITSHTKLFPPVLRPLCLLPLDVTSWEELWPICNREQWNYPWKSGDIGLFCKSKVLRASATMPIPRFTMPASNPSPPVLWSRHRISSLTEGRALLHSQRTPGQGSPVPGQLGRGTAHKRGAGVLPETSWIQPSCIWAQTLIHYR